MFYKKISLNVSRPEIRRFIYVNEGKMLAIPENLKSFNSENLNFTLQGIGWIRFENSTSVYKVNAESAMLVDSVVECLK